MLPLLDHRYLITGISLLPQLRSYCLQLKSPDTKPVDAALVNAEAQSFANRCFTRQVPWTVAEVMTQPSFHRDPAQRPSANDLQDDAYLVLAEDKTSESLVE